MTDTISLTCSKCSGDGVISGFEHYADGVCFDCQGRGAVGRISNDAMRKRVVHCLMGTADIVLDALAHDNRDRAEFYARGMVAELFQVGTDDARKVLDYVGAGAFQDERGAAHQAPTDAAAELRTYLITCGREAKDAL